MKKFLVNKILLKVSISHGEEDATVVPEVWECVVCSEACVEEVVQADLVAVADTDLDNVADSTKVSTKKTPKVWTSIKKLSLPK